MLLCCRVQFHNYSFPIRLKTALWRNWIKLHKIPSYSNYISDDDVYKYIEACDAVIIPRINDLNSGVLWLGMTFGKIIIASDTGSNPDNLKGTENLLYKPGDANSLALAIEKASTLEKERISNKNKAIAETWGTDNIARDCIKLARNSFNHKTNEQFIK